MYCEQTTNVFPLNLNMDTLHVVESKHQTEKFKNTLTFLLTFGHICLHNFLDFLDWQLTN